MMVLQVATVYFEKGQRHRRPKVLPTRRRNHTNEISNSKILFLIKQPSRNQILERYLLDPRDPTLGPELVSLARAPHTHLLPCGTSLFLDT